MKTKKHRKATEDALEELHRELAIALKDGVESIKRGIAGGEEIKGAAALLNVARQFLKDNGIENLPTPGDATKDLLDSLPFETEEDPAPQPGARRH